MDAPAIAQKRFMAAGVIKSDAGWGTAKAIAAAGGMLIDSDGGLVRTQPYNPANEADTPFTKEGDLGLVDPVDFSPEFFMRYDPSGIGILIAQLFGTAGTPVNQGAEAELHTIQWADENYGEFSTFAVERVSKILEVASAKPYSLDLSIADGFVRGVIGLRGDTVSVASTTNTSTELDALTYIDRGNRMKFSQMVVDMNDEGEGNATAETDLIVSDIGVHYERPHDSAYSAGGASVIEPMENGQSIITVTMTFPRMDTVNNTYFADFIAETEKKIVIAVTGAAIGASGKDRYMKLLFPRMRIINIDYPFDEIVPSTITLQAEEAASAPTGMSYTRPFLYFMNTTSTDYLA